MLGPIVHRGPDGKGIYQHDGVTLGHRRLSIIDLSERGAQPLTHDGLTVTFNGEIYNYVELRRQLRDLGHAFHTDTDTEVLLASYREWGFDCLERFDGMWSFALLDRDRRRLWCSRDRFGEKPFLYAWADGDFVFASEPRQLRALGFGRAPDLDALRQFLCFGSKFSVESTYFEGITNLLPGCNLFLDLDSMSVDIQRYYVPGDSGLFDGIAEPEFKEVFRSELSRSVGARLRSDVPIGMLLSGGVDSSLIASVAGPAYLASTGRRLRAVTAASGDPRNDETRYAKLVASQCQLDWQKVDVPASVTRESWGEATAIIEQPLGSSSHVMQMMVMERAKEAGCTVLLDGQGADESWLGYDRYLFTALREVPLRHRVAFARRTADTTGLGIRRWLMYGAYFGSPGVASLRHNLRLRQIGVRGMGASLRAAWASALVSDSTLAVQRKELQGEQLSALLRYADRTSMQYSLEDRLPFLNYRLVELSLVVPTSVKYRDGWTKWLLRRQLAETVHPSVAWRKGKIGFEASRASFDPGSGEAISLIALSPAVRSLGVEQTALRNAHEQVKWRLFAIALWEQVCGVHG